MRVRLKISYSYRVSTRLSTPWILSQTMSASWVMVAKTCISSVQGLLNSSMHKMILLILLYQLKIPHSELEFCQKLKLRDLLIFSLRLLQQLRQKYWQIVLVEIWYYLMQIIGLNCKIRIRISNLSYQIFRWVTKMSL